MNRDRRWSVLVPLLAVLLGSCSGPVEESLAEPFADEGWAFSYDDRGRNSKSSIDLRSLNEPVAGRSGFVRLAEDGNSFVLGDGTPARFWAIGSGIYLKPNPDEVKQHVRFLARMGVNMVRLHAQICSKGPNSKLTDVDEKEIDGIWRFVAEAKKQGIYVTISPYWANSADATRWGIAGHDSPGALWGLLFFDETLQRGYKAWATALYARPNPYTNIPLAQEPAVAIIQVQNEDSLLFWTSQGIKPAQQVALSKKFVAWLTEKYGSLTAAKEAWGGPNRPGDDIAGGKVALVDMYSMILQTPGQAGRRGADQFTFYAALQRRFYDEIGKFYREELGCKQLLNASNWRSANQTLMDDAERWTYSGLDAIAVNRYYNGGGHQGPNAGWRIEPGDKFTQHSALLSPRELPLNLKQVVGHPMLITESGWVNPLAYQAEGPFLASVYQSLTGVDAFYWFMADAVEYNTAPYFPYQQVQGQQPFLKWTASIPPILGGFPAAALLFRKGYVKQGEPVVHEERTLQSLWDRQTPLIAEDPAFDPNRDKAPPIAPKAGEKATVVDPLAFLVGPVEVKYDGDPSKSRVLDLSRYIDHQKKLIRSVTGEVALDYNIGLCTVDAPKAQGACGFLSKAGLITLHDLSIRSANVYAAILAVALDDLPLATSKRILIQIGTAARPTDWATKDVQIKNPDGTSSRGLEVVSTGRPPWRIADSEFGLSIKNPGLTKATILDPAGYPDGDVQVTKARNGITLTPPTDTMYLLVE
jgi:hypothetical protein